MKPRLIPQWRRAHRMFSVQAMVLASAIQGAWALMPDDLKAALPPQLVPIVSVALLLAGVAGRLVVQQKVSGPEDVGGMVHRAPWLPPKE